MSLEIVVTTPEKGKIENEDKRHSNNCPLPPCENKEYFTKPHSVHTLPLLYTFPLGTACSVSLQHEVGQTVFF